MPFELNVSRPLKDPGQSYPFEAEITLDAIEVFCDMVSFSPVAVHGSAVGASDMVTIRGEASCTAHAKCARCRKDVSVDLTCPIDALYNRQPDPEDPDQYPFEAYRLVLDDCVHDAVVLELPMRFLCSESCKGLCPTCGGNLNEGPCTCQKGDDDSNPFAALRSIVLNDEEV